MHALEVIIVKNAERAGRELAHAVTDNVSQEKLNDLCRDYAQQACLQHLDPILAAQVRAFERGYERGIQEG
jgi:hypothetical protein